MIRDLKMPTSPKQRWCCAILAVAISCVCRAGSTDVAVLQARAEKALSQKQYVAAQQDLQQLLALGVKTAPVYSNLGVALLHSGKPDQAIQALKKAELLAPSVAGIRLNLGLAYYHEHDYKSASDYFGQVLSLAPDHEQARYLKGLCDFMMDNFQAAADGLQPLYPRQQQNLEYLYMLGISYGMLKKTEQSQTTFAQLVQAGGDTPQLHLLLGRAYLALGNFPEASKELEAASKDETLPYAHYYQGVLAQKQDQAEKAAEEFAKEVALAPNNPWAVKELALIRIGQGDSKGATQLLRQGIIDNPDAPDLYAVLARIYLQSSQPKIAQPLLEKAVALDAQNGAYHYQLARAYLAQGLHAKADAEMARTRALGRSDTTGQMEQLSRGSQAAAQ
jgi:tetratricopeptide (TPR) repeat protein